MSSVQSSDFHVFTEEMQLSPGGLGEEQPKEPLQSQWLCVCVGAPSGGLSKIGSDPVKAVNDAVEESSNMITGIFKFAANLIAPDDDEGSVF